MAIHISEEERTRMDECFGQFRKAARSLVKSSLEKQTPEHEVRPVLLDLQRGVEKELAEILGSERAEAFCVALEAHPRVLASIPEN